MNGFTQDKIEVLIDGWIGLDEEFADLVLATIQQLDKRYKEMEKAMMARDVPLLKDLTHSLKGITGNFHMDELYQQFLRLDVYLKEHQVIDAHVDSMMDELKRFVSNMPDKYDHMVILPPKLDDVDIQLSVLVGGPIKRVLELLVKLSNQYEIHIDSAKDGLELLEKFYLSTYDMVLLDKALEVISASDVVAEINGHESLNKPEVILVTDHMFADQESLQQFESKLVILMENRV